MSRARFTATVTATGYFTLLGRVTAIDAGGPISPANPAEGRLLRIADVNAVNGIVLTLYDLSAATPSTPLAGYPVTLAPAAALVDVIQNAGVWLNLDTFGGNFQATIAGSNIPNFSPDHTYLATVKFTTTGGGANFGEWILPAAHVGPP